MKRSSRNRIPTVVQATTVGESLFFLAGLADVLRAAGLEMHAVASPGVVAGRFATRERVDLHPVSMSREISPWADALALIKLWRLLRALRPSIVHAHTPKAGLLVITASWIARVPVRIYHIHGLPWETAGGLRRLLLRMSDWLACRLANRVLCVSQSSKNLLIEAGLCPARKAEVLLNGSIGGVDARRFDPERVGASASAMRRARGIPNGAIVIGFVGRIAQDKGVAELAAAWQALSMRFSDLHLLLVGSEEPHDRVPARVMSVLYADPRVHVTGWVQDTAPFYGGIDILAAPTHREGFGLVALEAAAMRIPVVTTRITGCVDAVVEGETGSLVNPGDSTELANALTRYISDGPLRHQHGAAGRERALRDFAQDQMWASLADRYIRLGSSGRGKLPRDG
jgi:glycosyltransferase involved in cell wall biosynthesis